MNEPKIDEIVKAADDFTEDRPKDDPARDEIASQVASIRDKFDAFKAKAKSKADDLENSLGRARDFQATMNDLVVRLRAIEAKADRLERYYVDVEKIKQTETEIETNVKSDLHALQPDYESILRVAEELKDGKTNEEKSAVDERLEPVLSAWESATTKVDGLGDEIEGALSRAEDFHARVDEVVAWIGGKSIELDSASPVKATPSAVKEQIESHRPVLKAVHVYRGDVDQFRRDVGEFAQRIPADHPDRRLLDDAWAKVEKAYGDVETASTTRQSDLNRGLTRAEKFQSDGSTLLLWLSSTSIDIDSLQCTLDEPESVKTATSKAREIQDDIDRHGDAVKSLSSQIPVLTERLPEDEPSKAVVVEREQTVVDRYNKLRPIVKERIRLYGDVLLPKAEAFRSGVGELKPWLGEKEASLGRLGRKPADADAIKAQKDEIKVCRVKGKYLLSSFSFFL